MYFVYLGFGKSRSVTHLDNVQFMIALIKHLDAIPVIVSPSMSGMFSLPYLFDSEVEDDVTARAVAYVAVAPVMTKKYKARYSSVEVRLLVRLFVQFCSHCHAPSLLTDTDRQSSEHYC